MRSPQRMKTEFQKHLYSQWCPEVTIRFRIGFEGGATDDAWGVNDGGVEEAESIIRHAHVVVLSQASRSIFDLGIFNESAVVFYFDRDDESIRFEDWDNVTILFQENLYHVSPVKMNKAKGHTITLNNTSMATCVIAELKR